MYIDATPNSSQSPAPAQVECTLNIPKPNTADTTPKTLHPRPKILNTYTKTFVLAHEQKHGGHLC